MTSINRTPLLSICVSLQHCDPPAPKKKSLFLDCSNIPPLLFFHSPSDELNQESLFRLKVGHGCTLEIQGNERTSFTKWCVCVCWGGGFHCLCFISMVSKSTKRWSVDSFALLCHNATFNFRGVDGKQNMSEDVEDCHS